MNISCTKFTPPTNSGVASRRSRLKRSNAHVNSENEHFDNELFFNDVVAETRTREKGTHFKHSWYADSQYLKSELSLDTTISPDESLYAEELQLIDSVELEKRGSETVEPKKMCGGKTFLGEVPNSVATTFQRERQNQLDTMRREIIKVNLRLKDTWNNFVLRSYRIPDPYYCVTYPRGIFLSSDTNFEQRQQWWRVTIGSIVAVLRREILMWWNDSMYSQQSKINFVKLAQDPDLKDIIRFYCLNEKLFRLTTKRKRIQDSLVMQCDMNQRRDILSKLGRVKEKILNVTKNHKKIGDKLFGTRETVTKYFEREQERHQMMEIFLNANVRRSITPSRERVLLALDQRPSTPPNQIFQTDVPPIIKRAPSTSRLRWK